MSFDVSPLPYSTDALAPHIGKQTVELHFEKHHKGYAAKLDDLASRTPEAGSGSLESIVRSAQGELYQNAAQLWNHDFYWKCMHPEGGGAPKGLLLERLERTFGSFDAFRERFADAAKNEFGSGWAWLVREATGGLAVRSSSDADNPLRYGTTPLLTLDVWEHAYYLDYQNERARYVDAFLDHLVDWEFVSANLSKAPAEEGRVDDLGEGDRRADRRYREKASRFARSGRVADAAEAAAREVPKP